MLIEGYMPFEILDWPDEQVDALILTNTPIVFRAGTARLLGQFRIRDQCLVVELAEIAGGGEGVLPVLWLLAERYARRRGLDSVEWIVHAIRCAAPNPKLRRVLERRGFVITAVAGVGEAYYFRQPVTPTAGAPPTSSATPSG